MPHAVGREVAVLDALAQGVLQDGRAEVAVGVDLVLLLRCRREAHDLQRREGLARARGHQQQYALLAARDGAQDAVRGDQLVGPRRTRRPVGLHQDAVQGLLEDCLLRQVEIMDLHVPRPQFSGGGEAVEIALPARGEVALADAAAVGGVDERYVQSGGVLDPLLKALRGGGVEPLASTTATGTPGKGSSR